LKLSQIFYYNYTVDPEKTHNGFACDMSRGCVGPLDFPHFNMEAIFIYPDQLHASDSAEGMSPEEAQAALERLKGLKLADTNETPTQSTITNHEAVPRANRQDQTTSGELHKISAFTWLDNVRKNDLPMRNEPVVISAEMRRASAEKPSESKKARVTSPFIAAAKPAVLHKSKAAIGSRNNFPPLATLNAAAEAAQAVEREERRQRELTQEIEAVKQLEARTKALRQQNEVLERELAELRDGMEFL